MLVGVVDLSRDFIMMRHERLEGTKQSGSVGFRSFSRLQVPNAILHKFTGRSHKSMWL